MLGVIPALQGYLESLGSRMTRTRHIDLAARRPCSMLNDPNLSLLIGVVEVSLGMGGAAVTPFVLSDLKLWRNVGIGDLSCSQHARICLLDGPRSAQFS